MLSLTLFPIVTGIRVSGTEVWVPFSAYSFCGMTKEFGGVWGRVPTTLTLLLAWISQNNLNNITTGGSPLRGKGGKQERGPFFEAPLYYSNNQPVQIK